jgi:Polyketide cyclase / dehydrase and lipid transport
MKKLLRISGVILLVILLAFCVAGLLGPKEFMMKRTVSIKAPKTVIYKTLTDYTNFKKWSPWQMYDSAMMQECYGTQGQVGAGYKWKGNSQVGEGEMQTTALIPNERMDLQLTFGAPFKSHPKSSFTILDKSDGIVEVTWSFDQNEVPFMMRPFMLMMDMDKVVGGDYERGLGNLKTLCEKMPVE